MSEQKRTPMDEIMEKLQQGIQEMFQSDRYKEYLHFVSSLPQYSFNNSVLIASQRPDATLISGYKAWTKYGRHVKRGEKGIKIIAPMPKKTENLVEKKDPVTGKTLLDANGKPVMENVVIPQYRVVTVFDVSQTEGKELPTLDVQTLKGSIPHFEDLMVAIRRICPVPISIEKMEMEANGYYHHLEKHIVVKDGMSEAQTMKTALHETAHALLHDRDLLKQQNITKTSNEREVEAESVAYMVCDHFGLDTSSYTFGYVTSWMSSQSMEELRSSVDLIKNTASRMIQGMETELLELMKDRPGLQYEVYSLKQTGIAALYAERPLDKLAENGLTVHPEYYEVRASGTMPEGNGNGMETIRQQQELNTGDVILLAGAVTTAYYVDPDGLRELPDFDLQNSTGMDLSVMAAEIDTLMYDYNYYDYTDSFESREDGRAVVQQELETGNLRNIRESLTPIMTDEDSPELAQCAMELMDKMDQMGIEVPAKESVTYYVAESMAFPVLGSYTETNDLQEAVALYDKLPETELHGGKGIGATLESGDGSRRDVPLMINGTMQREHMSNELFKKSPALKEAFSGLEKMMPGKETPAVTKTKGAMER